MRKRRVPLRLFYSYCHSDSGLRNKLEEHLSLLHREGLIGQWYDGKIGAGCEIDPAIDSNLARSDVVLLLISAAFLKSDYCWDREMSRALKRHHKGTARVIPIILRPVEHGWQQTVFGRLKALPKDGKPVTKWANRDSAWADVATGLREAIRELRGAPSAPSVRKVHRKGRKGGRR
ncbi:MAG: TIR domain-containing protein [Candidatus Binatia bacterium]